MSSSYIYHAPKRQRPLLGRPRTKFHIPERAGGSTVANITIMLLNAPQGGKSRNSMFVIFTVIPESHSAEFPQSDRGEVTEEGIKLAVFREDVPDASVATDDGSISSSMPGAASSSAASGKRKGRNYIIDPSTYYMLEYYSVYFASLYIENEAQAKKLLETMSQGTFVRTGLRPVDVSGSVYLNMINAKPVSNFTFANAMANVTSLPSRDLLYDVAMIKQEQSSGVAGTSPKEEVDDICKRMMPVEFVLDEDVEALMTDHMRYLAISFIERADPNDCVRTTSNNGKYLHFEVAAIGYFWDYDKKISARSLLIVPSIGDEAIRQLGFQTFPGSEPLHVTSGFLYQYMLLMKPLFLLRPNARDSGSARARDYATHLYPDEIDPGKVFDEFTAYTVPAMILRGLPSFLASYGIPLLSSMRSPMNLSPYQPPRVLAAPGAVYNITNTPHEHLPKPYQIYMLPQACPRKDDLTRLGEIISEKRNEGEDAWEAFCKKNTEMFEDGEDSVISVGDTNPVSVPVQGCFVFAVCLGH